MALKIFENFSNFIFIVLEFGIGIKMSLQVLLLDPSAYHVPPFLSSLPLYSIQSPSSLEPEDAFVLAPVIIATRCKHVQVYSKHFDRASVGHGEAGSVEDCAQSEANGILQTLQRRPWQGLCDWDLRAFPMG